MSILATVDAVSWPPALAFPELDRAPPAKEAVAIAVTDAAVDELAVRDEIVAFESGAATDEGTRAVERGLLNPLQGWNVTG